MFKINFTATVPSTGLHCTGTAELCFTPTARGGGTPRYCDALFKGQWDALRCGGGGGAGARGDSGGGRGKSSGAGAGTALGDGALAPPLHL